jgi:hypothetical protein
VSSLVGYEEKEEADGRKKKEILLDGYYMDSCVWPTD